MSRHQYIKRIAQDAADDDEADVEPGSYPDTPFSPTSSQYLYDRTKNSSLNDWVEPPPKSAATATYDADDYYDDGYYDEDEEVFDFDDGGLVPHRSAKASVSKAGKTSQKATAAAGAAAKPAAAAAPAGRFTPIKSAAAAAVSAPASTEKKTHQKITITDTPKKPAAATSSSALAAPRTPVQQAQDQAGVDADRPTASPTMGRTPSTADFTKRERERKELLEEDAKSQGKQKINMVVIGHVDAGKSTLMGHLLLLLGRIDQRTMHRHEKESRDMGKESFKFAFVLDSTQGERERGITVDVALNHFETDTKEVTLLDAPGHRDFIPNMISGAAQADAAVLVITASKGEFESGFAENGQTKEHAILARSLGVNQIIVAVNKLDTTDPPWSKDRYDSLVEQTTTFLKSAGFKFIWTVPVSGLVGENLVTRKDPALSAWYNGPTLLELIDQKFTLPERFVDRPFRLCISDVFRSMTLGVTVAGKIEAGNVMPKDSVVIMPLVEVVTVKGIESRNQTMKIARAGDNVEIGLRDVQDANAVAVGMYLCDVAQPIPLVTQFRAQVLVLGLSSNSPPILKGEQVVLFVQSASEPAVITKLLSIIDKSTGEVVRKNPRHLTKNLSAVVEVSLSRPMCLEKYSDLRQLGRFSLRRGTETVGVGIVTDILATHKRKDVVSAPSVMSSGSN